MMTKSTWSKHNVNRVKKMINEGKMTPAGMELSNFAEKNGLLPDMDEEKKQKVYFPRSRNTSHRHSEIIRKPVKHLNPSPHPISCNTWAG